jgi:uncharacterized protein (TIGR03067 family)
MRETLALVALLGTCSAALNQASADDDRAALRGTWRPVSMQQDGKFLSKERIDKIRLTIRDDLRFTFTSGNNSHSGVYRIDPSKNPGELDIAVETGAEKGKVYLVIYKLEGGRMIQCMQVSNKNRPREFIGEAGSGNLLEVWEKVP